MLSKFGKKLIAAAKEGVAIARDGRKVISRAEAKARKLKWYFTGEPCPHGHVCERQTSGYGCRECRNTRVAIDRRTLKKVKPSTIVISRREAKAKGLKRFFTGLPCKRGHVSERFVSSPMCCDCHTMGNKKWNKLNVIKRRKQRAKWVANNKAKYREAANLNYRNKVSDNAGDYFISKIEAENWSEAAE